MRLMIVLPSLAGGGAERVFANLAAYFAGFGWAVCVVTFGGKNLDAYTLDARVDRIELRLLSESRNPMQGLVAVVRRIVAIRRAIGKHRPDVIVGVMPSSAIICILAACGTKASVIAAERSYPPALSLPPYWNWLRSRLYRYAAAVTIQTERAAAWARGICPPGRVAVIPNACHWPIGENEPFVSPPVSQPFVLAVGRLGHEKGFDLLIEAWAKIADRLPGWQLVIAGEGEERDKLQELVERQGLLQRVSLPGRVGNIADWFTAAELFVLSSRFEGFPNVLVEAMAAGCAVVAFDCCAGPRDIVRDGVDGRLVPAGDVGALAATMEQLLNDPRLRARYARSAKCIANRLSADRIYGQWQELCLSTRKQT